MQGNIKNVAGLEGGVDNGINYINGSVNCDLLYIAESEEEKIYKNGKKKKLSDEINHLGVESVFHPIHKRCL